MKKIQSLTVNGNVTTMSNANLCSTEQAVHFILHVKIRKLVRERLIIKLVCHIRNIYQHTNTTQKCLTSKAHYISFSILLKTKAMVGESRRSDNGGEAERKDNNDTGNLINILIVTITVKMCPNTLWYKFH